TYGRKAFIVSGKVVTKLGTVQILMDRLKSWNIEYELFNDVIGEPTDEMLTAGVKAYKDAKCDFCIAIGGGSPLDLAKAIIAMTVLDGDITDYQGKMIEGVFPPLVAIPTTSGTGSETTKFTIITDTKRNVKMLLKGNSLIPTLAIIDPAFTISSPKSITAATGMDALTHAVESYTSRKANSMTDLYALSAIKRIFAYLPVAYQDGTNVTAREELSIAAFEAGVCINNASVTIVHGMSRPIGALFHVPHGISNAMLIKECLAYVLDGAYGKFADIARAIGVATEDMPADKAANRFIEALGELCKTCEIPTLEEYGIVREEFESQMDKMAQDAMDSGSPGNTIKVVAKEDLIKIYKEL
ncbi:MAG TPA: iron-containing alcohol dehydrogenase, partial [Lachnospiraceae bacterium]|nr:iron-containing alcohol dehydrogenase [Lachnospiraceae bacterium]